MNIFAGRRVVPEFMPWGGRCQPVLEMIQEVMAEPGCLLDVRRDMLAAIDSLRTGVTGSASENAADLIVESLLRAKRR